MRIDVRRDTRRVMRDLRALPDITEKAQVTALNKTTSKINTAFRRELSRRTGIKQKTLRRTLRQYRASKRRPKSAVWIGLRSLIPVGEVLKGKRRTLPAQLEALVEYPAGRGPGDVFRASIGGRPENLFVRSTKERYPVKSLRINLEPVAPRALMQAADAIGPEEFRRQLEYDIGRRLRRVGNAPGSGRGGRRR